MAADTAGATLAHEIAHLLVDRDGALPVAEVLGGRLPAQVEARARAFAAEFLLPQEIARHTVLGDADPSEEVVRGLGEMFGSSQEIVAWQIRNAARHQLPAATLAHLRSLVSGSVALVTSCQPSQG